ncbi:DUF2752 domain-containing protein [uncultured Kriegella sp.]|uniref:DUF2752 domain-containing protein n=1 Tax=uncultured Kriegella sp. TaxID=1798910 RepID=UPI0030DA50A5|tara:strand:- start:31569 stop:31868 length:300 start_codon:yes stop_codon:yes gene_type:complete
MQLATFILAIEDYMLPCITKKLFDFDCPGCGLQRSVVLLLKGDFSGAFEMYPAIYSIALLFGFLLINNFFTIKYANKVTIILMISSVALILGNFILKII